MVLPCVSVFGHPVGVAMALPLALSVAAKLMLMVFLIFFSIVLETADKDTHFF